MLDCVVLWQIVYNLLFCYGLCCFAVGCGVLCGVVCFWDEVCCFVVSFVILCTSSVLCFTHTGVVTPFILGHNMACSNG